MTQEIPLYQIAESESRQRLVEGSVELSSFPLADYTFLPPELTETPSNPLAFGEGRIFKNVAMPGRMIFKILKWLLSGIPPYILK